MKYIGNGYAEYVPGVPMRDLSSDEITLYGDLIRQWQKETGNVYFEIDAPKPKPKRTSRKMKPDIGGDNLNGNN